jgi:hypothetical protein
MEGTLKPLKQKKYMITGGGNPACCCLILPAQQYCP